MSAISYKALKPSASTLCKLGSLLVHVDEVMSKKGHVFDIAAMQSILSDPEVKEWIAAMDKMALLPVKR